MSDAKPLAIHLGSCFLTGLVWGATWMVIVGVTFMLVSGAQGQPSVGLAALAGGVAAVVQNWFAPERRGDWRIQLGSTLVFLALLPAFGQPFGVPWSEEPLLQLVALVGLVALQMGSIYLCTRACSVNAVNRYQLELLLLRVLKGWGLMFLAVIVVLPFYVMLMTSFKSQQALIANPLDLSLDFSGGIGGLLRSYRELFVEFSFGIFMWNSLLVSVVTVIFTLLFAVPGAYVVARMRFPGQGFLSRTILLIYMVPAIVLVIPLYAVFSQLGLRNSLVGLFIVYPATTIPVALYMLQGYFRNLPAELEEAGLMDGLGRLGVIVKITMPLSLPALASVSLYVFMIAWNEFLFAFMFLDNTEIFTLPRGVVSLNSSEVPRQHLMAGAVVSTIPILVAFLWAERFLVAGLTAGSVKG